MNHDTLGENYVQGVYRCEELASVHHQTVPASALLFDITELLPSLDGRSLATGLPW